MGRIPIESAENVRCLSCKQKFRNNRLNTIVISQLDEAFCPVRNKHALNDSELLTVTDNRGHNSVAWVISTRGGLQFCPQSREMPDAPLITPIFRPVCRPLTIAARGGPPHPAPSLRHCLGIID